MSWKPEVLVEGKWSRNGLVFPTESQALASAKDLMWRWMSVQDARAVEVNEPVNYVWLDGKAVFVEKIDEPAPQTDSP